MAEMAVANTDEVTLGDRTVETTQYDRYKGTKGRTDRLAIVSTKLLRGYRYYHPGTKTVFRAPPAGESLDLCRKELGEPDQKFGLVLFHYTTGEDGVLLEERKFQGKIKLWIISEARYEELSTLHKSWPLLDAGFASPQHDFTVKCTEEQYQKMTITPQPNAHWKAKQSWYDNVAAKRVKANERVKMMLGKTLTDTEIMALFGASTAAPTGSTNSAGDVNLDDILDEE